MGVDDIPSTIENESNKFERVGSFSYKNSMAKVAYQVSVFDNFHIGTGLSYYMTTMDQVIGKGYNFDFGAIFGSETFQGSLVFKNMVGGLRVKYTDETDYSTHTQLSEEDKNSQSSDGQVENLPFMMVLSAKKKWKQFVFYAQHKSIENHQDAAKSYGVEYTPKFLSIFKVSGAIKKYPVVRSSEGVIFLLDIRFNAHYHYR